MTIKKLLKLALALAPICFVCCKENMKSDADITPSKTVTLKGIFEGDVDENVLTLSNYTKNTMLFEEETHNIPLGENQTFNYSFTINEPAYYRIGRSYLYLSPGDSLDIVLTDRRSTTRFKGKGANANNYLTTVTYPKGGSFWGDLRFPPGEQHKNVKVEHYNELPEIFTKVYKKRMAHLDSVQNVSKEFMELEKARLRFDYINSLENLFYLYYPELRKGELTEVEMDEKMKVAETYLIPYKKEVIGDFNDEKYLQLEVFQSLLYNLKDKEYRTALQLPDLNDSLKEYTLTNNLIYGFNTNGYTQEFIADYNEKRKTITNEKYLKALDKKESKYNRIAKGVDAPDVTFTDLSDNKVKLSAYKGKVIVMDLWATWCGPCMDEKPYFEALEEKYKNNSDIVFLPISIDKKSIWKSYFEKHEPKGEHLQIPRTELSEYQVVSIPRFFVIDKDFKIVDVFAPRPSSGKLETMIQEIL